MKRAAKVLEDFDSDGLTDIEDVFPPKPTFSNALSAFAYESAPTTRLRAKKPKYEDVETIEDPEAGAMMKKSPSKRKLAVTTSPSLSPRKVKPIRMELEKPHAAPSDWKETYDLIKQMRSEISAPVDTMGCASAMKSELSPTVSTRMTTSTTR